MQTDEQDWNDAQAGDDDIVFDDDAGESPLGGLVRESDTVRVAIADSGCTRVVPAVVYSSEHYVEGFGWCDDLVACVATGRRLSKEHAAWVSVPGLVGFVHPKWLINQANTGRFSESTINDAHTKHFNRRKFYRQIDTDADAKLLADHRRTHRSTGRVAVVGTRS